MLGLDIEIIEREGSVGSFAVDLVGKDLGSGRTVIATPNCFSCFEKRGYVVCPWNAFVAQDYCLFISNPA